MTNCLSFYEDNIRITRLFVCLFVCLFVFERDTITWFNIQQVAWCRFHDEQFGILTGFDVYAFTFIFVLQKLSDPLEEVRDTYQHPNASWSWRNGENLVSQSTLNQVSVSGHSVGELVMDDPHEMGIKIDLIDS